MLRPIRFRLLLAGSGTAVAAVFGALGHWQRNHILSQPFFNGATWWDSTARFHVWPWPYKLAAICNMPAFIGGSITMLPIRLIWPTLPETAELIPSIGIAALIWYSIGRCLETHSATTRWTSLLVFYAFGLIGAFTPMGYTGWLPYGVLLWCIAVLLLRRSRRPVSQSPA